MVVQQHQLVISEDEGNTKALALSETTLCKGGHVTWICSIATTAALKQAEQIAALKNAHLTALNLLVITREENQPFAVLTGSLDSERLDSCAQLLFDPTTIDQCEIVTAPELATQLGAWAKPNLPAAQITTHALLTEQANTTPGAEEFTGADKVVVTIIKAGRETQFQMRQQAGTLLDGAEDAGIDLPFSCRGGVCSTCRALLRSGEVTLRENYALEDWELDQGFTLPCQAEPISPKIRLDYDEV